MRTKQNFTILKKVQTKKVEINFTLLLSQSIATEKYFQKYLGRITRQQDKIFLVFKPLEAVDAYFSEYEGEIFELLNALSPNISLFNKLKFLKKLLKWIHEKRHFLKNLHQQQNMNRSLIDSIRIEKIFSRCNIQQTITTIQKYLIQYTKNQQKDAMTSINKWDIQYYSYDSNQNQQQLTLIQLQSFCHQLLKLERISIYGKLKKLLKFCEKSQLLLIGKNHPQNLQEMKQIYICQQLKNDRSMTEYKNILKEQIKLHDYKSQGIKYDFQELKTLQFQLYNSLLNFQMKYKMVYLFDPAYIFYDKKNKKVRLGFQPFLLDSMEVYQKNGDFQQRQNIEFNEKKQQKIIHVVVSQKINQSLNRYFDFQARLKYQGLNFPNQEEQESTFQLTKDENFINIVKTTFFISNFTRDNFHLTQKIISSKEQAQHQLIRKYIRSIYFLNQQKARSFRLNCEIHHFKNLKQIIQSKCDDFNFKVLSSQQKITRFRSIKSLTLRDIVNYINGQSITFVNTFHQIQTILKDNIGNPFLGSYQIVSYFLITLIYKILQQFIIDDNHIKKQKKLIKAQLQKILKLLKKIQKQKQFLSQTECKYLKKIMQQSESTYFYQTIQNYNCRQVIKRFNLVIRFTEKEYLQINFLQKKLKYKGQNQIRKFHIDILHLKYKIMQIIIIYASKSIINLDLNVIRSTLKLVQLTKLQKKELIDIEDYDSIINSTNKIRQQIYQKVIQKINDCCIPQKIKLDIKIQQLIKASSEKFIRIEIQNKNNRIIQRQAFLQGQRQSLQLEKKQFQSRLQYQLQLQRQRQNLTIQNNRNMMFQNSERISNYQIEEIQRVLALYHNEV